VSLEEVARQFTDEELTREINTLNTCLYSANQNNWSGTGLADCLRRLRRAGGNGNIGVTEQIRLYPKEI